jgi:hypothetical protein
VEYARFFRVETFKPTYGHCVPARYGPRRTADRGAAHPMGVPHHYVRFARSSLSTTRPSRGQIACASCHRKAWRKAVRRWPMSWRHGWARSGSPSPALSLSSAPAPAPAPATATATATAAAHSCGVPGSHYAIRTRTVTAVTPDVVWGDRGHLGRRTGAPRRGSALTSPLSGIAIPPFHGAAARLLAAKRHYDPHAIFSAAPLPTRDRP